MLFFNSFKVPFTFPLVIRTLNFLDILEMFVAFSGTFERSCIAWPKYSRPSILSSLQSDIILLVLLDVLSILKIYSVFEVIKLASHGALLVLLIHMVCHLPIA